MLRPFLYTTALCAALAACGGDTRARARSVTQSLPAVLWTDPAPPSLDTVQPYRLREALKAAYRLKPDVRFLEGVAEVHRLVTGTRADTVRVHWSGTAWSIEYAGEYVADLRDLPDFTDGTAMLDAWAAHLVQAHSLASGTPGAAELDSARARIGEVRAPRLAAGFRLVDAGWAKSHQAAWLPIAALGLTILAIQVPRVEMVGDPIVARALAATAVARAAGERVTAERVLLAWHMGYATRAAALADSLPASDPARLLAQRHSAGLRVAANESKAPALTQYLYLLRLAADGNETGFDAWHWAHANKAPSSGAIAAGVALAKFVSDAAIVPDVPAALAVELREITGRTSRMDRLGDAVAGLLGHPAPLLGGIAWSGVLSPRESTGGGALWAFEQDLLELDTLARGPWLDRDLFATYFRAQLHAGFERACIHRIDGLASTIASDRFAGAFAGAPQGVWADAATWCRHRAAIVSGRATVEEMIEDLRDLNGLSSRAVEQSVDDIASRLPYHDQHDLKVARALFGRLDSRPDQLRRAAQTASDELSDVPLSGALYGRNVELAAAEYPQLDAWYASYRGDLERLRAIAKDSGLVRTARFEALGYLLEESADTATTFAAYDRLIAEDPDNWDVRKDYIDVLERSKRPLIAERVAKEWFEAHSKASGFDALSAATALARQYQRTGRAAEGWTLLEPLVASYQLGVMQRAALIALDLGRAAVADTLARRIVERYPASAYGRITLAEVLWGRRQWANAAAVLQDAQHPIGQDDWRHVVAAAFVRVFAHRAVADAQAAARALKEGDTTQSSITALAREAADSAYYPLALALMQQVSSNDREHDVDMYRFYVAAQGERVAHAWLESRWTAADGRRQSLLIYRQGLYSLLWNLNVTPDETEEGSYFWLVRAMGWVSDPKHDTEQRAQLLAYYRMPGTRFYYLAGRFLMGLDSEATLLTFANTAHHRIEVGYYLGIKAASEGRYTDASEWLRTTVELENDARDWEPLWAKDLLFRWEAQGRVLPVAASKVAARPPRW